MTHQNLTAGNYFEDALKPVLLCFEILGVTFLALFFRGLSNFKRPSHGKLKFANSCWQTQVGVCERHKKRRQTRLQTVGVKQKRICRLFLCRSHTHQLEFANFSFLCEGRFSLQSFGTIFSFCRCINYATEQIPDHLRTLGSFSWCCADYHKLGPVKNTPNQSFMGL